MSTAFRYFFAASEQGYDLAHGKSRQGRCNGYAVVVVDDHADEDNDDVDDDGSDDDDDDDHDSDEEKKEDDDDDASYYHHHKQQQFIDSSHCFQVGRGSASRKGPGLSRTSPGQSVTT